MTDEAGFDRAVRLYAEIGLSDERTIGQLLRAGFPVAAVRTRFPHIGAAYLGAPRVAFTTPGRYLRGTQPGVYSA